MNKEELANEISLLKENMRSLVDLAEAEKRELKDEEKATFEESNKRLNDLTAELKEAEAREQAEIEAQKRSLEQEEELNKNKQNIRMKNAKELLAEQIQAVANSRSVEAYDNVTGNKIELRATTLYDNIDNVQTEHRLEILEPLQNALLIDKIGCKVVTTGKAVTLPSVNNAVATIEGETTELTGEQIDFSKQKVTPYRVGVSLPFSGAAIREADIDLVSYAIKLAGRAEAQLINNWMFNPKGVVGNDSSTAHAGIFTAKLAGDSSVAKQLNWQNIVDLEVQVKAKNCVPNETAAYVMSPKTEGVLKSMPVALKGGNHTAKFIIEDGKINGYPYLVSNACRDASNNDYIGFGVFDNVLVQRVGEPFIVVDFMSQSKKDITEVNLNDMIGLQIIRDQAFSCFPIDASSYIA